MSIKVSRVEDVIHAAQQGKMFIMLDNADRENEGDLMVLSECVTTHIVNFMISQGRGLLCVAVTPSRAVDLGLMLSPRSLHNPFDTPFALSIEAKTGVTTGISASDRAHTILTLVSEKSKASDVVSPGHIFPLISHPQGLLKRFGHTEAAVEVGRLAGSAIPSCTLCELLDDNGVAMRLPEILVFAEQHDLCVGTVESLRRYLLKHRRENVCSEKFQTDSKGFSYYRYKDYDLSEECWYVCRSEGIHQKRSVNVHIFSFESEDFFKDEKRELFQAARERIGGDDNALLLMVLQGCSQDLIFRVLFTLGVKELNFIGCDGRYDIEGYGLKVGGSQ